MKKVKKYKNYQYKIIRIACIILTLVMIMSTMVSEAEKFNINKNIYTNNEGSKVTYTIQPSQRRNILLTVTANIDNLKSVSISVYPFTQYVNLIAYSPGMDISPTDISISGSSTVSASYTTPSGVTATSGKVILECYFNTVNSSISASLAKSGITTFIDAAMLQNNTVPVDPAVTFTTTLLGDINNDEEVDSSDALMALQASTSSIILTPAQALAGDVDRDGDNDAADALLILQYSTASIISFFGGDTIVPIPVSETAGIESGTVYRIENLYSGKRMKSDWFTANSLIKQYTYAQASLLYKYLFEYTSDGKYKISLEDSNSNKDDNQVLSVNSSGNVIIQAKDDTNLRQRWYVVPYKSGYLIINAYSTYQTRFLTVAGLTTDNSSVVNTKNICGNVWKLYRAEVTVNNYYDYGYNARYPSSPSSYINNCQEDINDVFQNLFNITVESANTPTLITSYGDSCYSSVSSINSSNIDNLCTHATSLSCSNNNSLYHHKNISLMCTAFYNWCETNNIRPSISALLTGYPICYVYNENTAQESHEYNTVDGIAKYLQQKCVITIRDSDANSKIINSLDVMLHEESHILGLGIGSSDTQHGQCVMSYNQNRRIIYEDIVNGNYDYIYCDECKNYIIDALKYF